MMTTDIQNVKNRKVLSKEINLTEKCMCTIVSSLFQAIAVIIK